MKVEGMSRGRTHVHDAERMWAGAASQLARVYWLPFSVTGITGAVQFVRRRRSRDMNQEEWQVLFTFVFVVMLATLLSKKLTANTSSLEY